jgi:hypothetical protein
VRLWEAITLANSGDKIFLENDTICENDPDKLPESLQEGFPYYVIKDKTGGLTIEGGFKRGTRIKEGYTTIKPPTGGRIMFILRSTVSITDVCFTEGNAVKNRSLNLTIDDFEVNPYAGGALYVAESNLALTNTQFIGNKGYTATPLAMPEPVPVQGGGLLVEGGKVTVGGTTVVRDNEANRGDIGLGGGMAFMSAEVVFEGTLRFENNVATRDCLTDTPMGGAIYYESSQGVCKLSFEGVTAMTFKNNIAGVNTGKGFGGALAVIAPDLTAVPWLLALGNAEFRDNIALDNTEGIGMGYGGAVYVRCCDVIAWKKTVMEGNIASTGKGEAKGGAIYLAKGNPVAGSREPKLGLLDESVIRCNYGTNHPDASAAPYAGGGVYAEDLEGLILHGDYTPSGGLVPQAVPPHAVAPRIYDNFPSIDPDKCSPLTIRNIYPHKTLTAYLHVEDTPPSSSGYRFDSEYIDVTPGSLVRFTCVAPSNASARTQPEVFVLPLESSSEDPSQLQVMLVPKETTPDGVLSYEYQLTGDVEIYLSGTYMLQFDNLKGSLSYEEQVLPGPLHAGFPGLETPFAAPYTDTLYFTMQIKNPAYAWVDSRITIMEGSTVRGELLPYHREEGLHYYKYEPLLIQNVNLKPRLEHLVFRLPSTEVLNTAGLVLPTQEELEDFTQPKPDTDYYLSVGHSFTFYVRENDDAGNDDAILPTLTFSGLQGEKVTAIPVGNNLYRFTIQVPDFTVVGLPSGSLLSFQFIRAKRVELNVQVGYGTLAKDFSETPTYTVIPGLPKDGILAEQGWFYYSPPTSRPLNLGLRVKCTPADYSNYTEPDYALVPYVTLNNRVLNFKDVDDPANLFRGHSVSMLCGRYTYYFNYECEAEKAEKIEDYSNSDPVPVQPLSATLCIGKTGNYNIYFPKLSKYVFPLSLLSYTFGRPENISADPSTFGAPLKAGVNLLKSDGNWVVPFALTWDGATVHNLRPVVTRMSLVQRHEEGKDTIFNKKAPVALTEAFNDSLCYEIEVKNENGFRDAIMSIALDVTEIEYPQLPWGMEYEDKRPAGMHYFGSVTSTDEGIDTFTILLPHHIEIEPVFTIERKDLPEAAGAKVELIENFTDRYNKRYGYRVQLSGKNASAVIKVKFDADYVITLPYRKEMPEGIRYKESTELGGPHYYKDDDTRDFISIPLIIDSKRVGLRKAVFTPEDPKEEPIDIEVDYVDGEGEVKIPKVCMQTGTLSFVTESYKVVLLPLSAGVNVAEKSGLRIGDNFYSINLGVNDSLVVTLAPNYIGFTPEVKIYTTSDTDDGNVESLSPCKNDGDTTFYYKIEGNSNLWIQVSLSDHQSTVTLSKQNVPVQVRYGDRLEGDYHLLNGKSFVFTVDVPIGNSAINEKAIPLPQAHELSGGKERDYQYQPVMKGMVSPPVQHGTTWYYRYRYEVAQVNTNIRITVPEVVTGELVLPDLPEELEYEFAPGSFLSKGSNLYGLTESIDKTVTIKVRDGYDVDIPCFAWKTTPSGLNIENYFNIFFTPSDRSIKYGLQGSFWGEEDQGIARTWKTVITKLELAVDESYYTVTLPGELPTDGDNDVLKYNNGSQAGTYSYNQSETFQVEVSLLPKYKEARVVLTSGTDTINGVREGDTYRYILKDRNYTNLSFGVAYRKLKINGLQGKGLEYVIVPHPQSGAGEHDYYFKEEDTDERILDVDTTGVWFGLKANVVGNTQPQVMRGESEVFMSSTSPDQSGNGWIGYYYILFPDPERGTYPEVEVTIDRRNSYCVTLPELEEDKVVYYEGEDANVFSAGEYLVQTDNTCTFYLQLKNPYRKATLTVWDEDEELAPISGKGNPSEYIYCYRITDEEDNDRQIEVEVEYSTVTLPESLLDGLTYEPVDLPIEHYLKKDTWTLPFTLRVEDTYRDVEPIVRFQDGSDIPRTQTANLLYTYTATGTGDKRIEIGWNHVSVTLPSEDETFRYENVNPATYPVYHTQGATIILKVRPYGVYSEGTPYIVIKDGIPLNYFSKNGNVYEFRFRADVDCSPQIIVSYSMLSLPQILPEGLKYKPFEGQGEFRTTRYHRPQGEWADSFMVETLPGYENIPPIVSSSSGARFIYRLIGENTYLYKFTNQGELTLLNITLPYFTVTLPEENPSSFSYIMRPSRTRYALDSLFSFSICVAEAYLGSEPVAMGAGLSMRGVCMSVGKYRFEFPVKENIQVVSIDLRNSALFLPELPAGLLYAPGDANKLTRYHSDQGWEDSFRIDLEPLYGHIIPMFNVQRGEGAGDEVLPPERRDGSYWVYKICSIGGVNNVGVNLPYEPYTIDFPAEDPDTFFYVGEKPEETMSYHKGWPVKFTVKSSGEYEESEPVAVVYGKNIRRLRGKHTNGVYTFSFNLDIPHTVMDIEPFYVTFTLPELPIGLSYAEEDMDDPVRRHKPDIPWTERFTLKLASEYREMMPVVKNNGLEIQPNEVGDDYSYTVNATGNSNLEISLPCATVRLPETLPDELEYLEKDAGNLVRIHEVTGWTERFGLRVLTDKYKHIVPVVRTSKGDILTGMYEESGQVYRYTVEGQGDMFFTVEFPYHTVTLPPEDPNLFTYAGSYQEGPYIVSTGEVLTIPVQPCGIFADLDLMAVLNSLEVVHGKKRLGSNSVYDITFPVHEDYIVKISPYYYTLVLPQTLPNGLVYDPRYRQGGYYYSSTMTLFSDTVALAVTDEMLWEVIPQMFLTIDGVVTDSLLKPYKTEGLVHFYSLRFLGNASVKIEMNYQACAFILPETLPAGIKYVSGSKGAGTYTHFISTSYRDTFALETEEDFANFRPIVTVGEKEITPYHRDGRRYYYAVEAINTVLVDIRMSYFLLSLPLPSALPVGLAYTEEPNSYFRFCTKGESFTLTLDVLPPYENFMPVVRFGTLTLTPVKLSSNRYRYMIRTSDVEGLSAEVTIRMDGVQVTLPSLPAYLSYVPSIGLGEGVHYLRSGIDSSFVISKQAGYEAGAITVTLNGQVLEGVPLDEDKSQVEYFFRTGNRIEIQIQVSFGYYAVTFPDNLPDELSVSSFSTLQASKIYAPEPIEKILVIGAPIYKVIPTVKLESEVGGMEKLVPYHTEINASQRLFYYKIPIASSLNIHIGIESCLLILPELPEGLVYVDGYPGPGEHEYAEGSTFTFRVQVLPPYEEAEPVATYIKNNVPITLYRARVNGTTFAFSGTMNMETISPEIVLRYIHFTLPELPEGLSYRSDSKGAGDYYYAPDVAFVDSFVLLLDEDKINLVPIATSIAGELSLTYEPPFVYKYKLMSLVDTKVSVSLPQYTVTLPELPEEQLSYAGDVAAGEYVLGYGGELPLTLEVSDPYASAVPYVRIFGETYHGMKEDNSCVYKFSIPVYGNDASEIGLKYLSLTLPEASENVAYLQGLKQQGVYFYTPDETFCDSFALQPLWPYHDARLQVLCNGQPLAPYRSDGKVCYYCLESDVDVQVDISLLYETFLLTLPELPEGLSYVGIFTEAGVHEVYGTTAFTDTLILQTDPNYSLVTPKVFRGVGHPIPLFSETVLPDGGKRFRYVVTGTENVTLLIDLPYYTLTLPALSGVSGALKYTDDRNAGTYRVSPNTPFGFSIQVTDPVYANVSPFVQMIDEEKGSVNLAAKSVSGTTYSYSCVYNTQTTVLVKVSMPHDTLFLPPQNTLPEGVSYASGSIAAGTHFYTRGKIASFSLSVAQDVYVLPLVMMNGNSLPYGQTGNRIYRFEFPIKGYTGPQFGTQPFIVLTLPPDLPTGVMYAANSKAGGKYYHSPVTSFRDTFALTVQERYREVVPFVSVDGEVEVQPYLHEENTYRYIVTGNRDVEISVAFEYYTVTVPEPPSGVSFAESSPIKAGLYFRPKDRNTTDEIILQLRDDLDPDKLVLTFNGHLPCPVSESTENEFVYLVSSSGERFYNIYYDYRCIVLPELPSGLSYASAELSSEIIKPGVYYFSNRQVEPFTFRIVIADALLQQGRLPVVNIGVETILPVVVTNLLYEYTINSSIEADLYVKISLFGDTPPYEPPPPPTSIDESFPDAAPLSAIQYADGEFTFRHLAGYRLLLTATDGRLLRIFLIGSEVERYRLSLPPGVYILVGQKGASLTLRWKFIIR